MANVPSPAKANDVNLFVIIIYLLVKRRCTQRAAKVVVLCLFLPLWALSKTLRCSAQDLLTLQAQGQELFFLLRPGGSLQAHSDAHRIFTHGHAPRTQVHEISNTGA